MNDWTREWFSDTPKANNISVCQYFMICRSCLWHHFIGSYRSKSCDWRMRSIRFWIHIEYSLVDTFVTLALHVGFDDCKETIKNITSSLFPHLYKCHFMSLWVSNSSCVLVNVSFLSGISSPCNCLSARRWSPCCSWALFGLPRTKLPSAVFVETTHHSPCWLFCWPVTSSYQCWEAWPCSCLG